MSFALNQILNSQWAMTDEALRLMLSVVKQHTDAEALEKIRGERIRNTEKATIRNGVGVIPLRGPLFKRANLMTDHCGATSYDLVLRDVHEMLASDQVRSIVLDIDSPGDEANGCSELADHIFEARGQKPIAAYIGGTGASAAYWIASACDRVHGSDSAIVGSIGVQSALRSEKTKAKSDSSRASPPTKTAILSPEKVSNRFSFDHTSIARINTRVRNWFYHSSSISLAVSGNLNKKKSKAIESLIRRFS